MGTLTPHWSAPPKHLSKCGRCDSPTEIEDGFKVVDVNRRAV